VATGKNETSRHAAHRQQTPLWIARQLLGWRLIRGDPSNDAGPAPLAIRDLMVARRAKTAWFLGETGRVLSVAEAGLVPVDVTEVTCNDLRQSPRPSAAESGADLAFAEASATTANPDVVFLIQQWQTLPDAIKTGILAIIRSVTSRPNQTLQQTAGHGEFVGFQRRYRMAWRRANAQRYYYRTASLRAGQRRLYVGPGEVGRPAEEADRLFANQRSTLRDGIMARKAAYLTVGRQLNELFAESLRLTTAALLASGYYKNSNTWRRRSPELRLRVCRQERRAGRC